VQRAKRILFLGHSAQQGGAELCLDSLLRNLQPGKFEATVLFPWEGPMAESARSLGMAVEVWPLMWWMCWEYSAWYFKRLMIRSLPTICRLARKVKQQRIDLVYSNTAVIFEGALAARLAGVPHIWHIHEIFKPGNLTRPVLPLWLIKRLIRSLSQCVVFESHASRRTFEAGRPDEHSTVVHNCVRFPVPVSHEDPAEARMRLGFDKDDQVVGFVGQFSERKNPLLLVRAAARLAECTRLRFLFVGEGPLQSEMEREMERLGIRACCRIVPFQSDITWVMSLLDVLVLPSRQESFGLVLVEAAAFGKPVIASRVDGPTEIVEDGVTGFLVDSEDEQGLAAKIEYLFSSRVDRAQMGRAAVQRARELFSPAEYARKLEQAIDKVLDANK
jgi:glycosyltransferase involved in cell wall biosynthesis